MDFHLDWNYASLYAHERGDINFITENNLKLNANQEDIDLLLAFKNENIYHLILIVAKAESGWTNKQFLSKAEKLKSIFGTTSCN